MGWIAITLEELEVRQIKNKLLNKHGFEGNCMFCAHLRPYYETQRIGSLNRVCYQDKLPYTILGKDSNILTLNMIALTAGAACEDYK